MRFLRVLFLLCVFSLPLAASAQTGMPLFDPNWQLVPKPEVLDPANCKPGDPLSFGAVLQLIQNGMNAVISLGVIIAVLVMVFAGILWILTPTNPENHSQARKMLTNAAIGMLIILAAWLIVDFVMKTLYDENKTAWGPWNAILIGGKACVTEMDTQPLFSGDIYSRPGEGTGGFETGGGGGTFTYPPSGPGVCSYANLLSMAGGNGMQLSEEHARVYACLAKFESTCGTNLKNYAWGRGSSAYGAFQVLLDGNAKHYENAVCRTAAGLAPTQPLNCGAGFRGGNPIAGSAIADRCIRAASNHACSLAAAIGVQREQGFKAWAADPNSAKQQQCIRGR